MGFVIPTQRIPPPKPHRDLVHDHDWFVQVNERATPQDWPQDVIDEVAREIAEAALPSPEAAAVDYRFPLDNAERDAEICARYAAGGVTQAKLADEYGVSGPRISQIITAEHNRRVSS